MFNSPSCTKTAYQGICKTNVRSTHACQCSGFSFAHSLSLFNLYEHAGGNNEGKRFSYSQIICAGCGKGF